MFFLKETYFAISLLPRTVVSAVEAIRSNKDAMAIPVWSFFGLWMGWGKLHQGIVDVPRWVFGRGGWGGGEEGRGDQSQNPDCVTSLCGRLPGRWGNVVL